MEAYKEVIKELVAMSTLLPSVSSMQDEYNLDPVYNIIDDSIAFPFDRFIDLLFIDRTKLDLGMWFESKKPLITWSLMDKKNHLDGQSPKSEGGFVEKDQYF